MILDLAEKWHINLQQSVMVGDRASDVEAGLRAGCHSYLCAIGDLDSLAQDILKRHFGA
jgi:histidinol phosphatase-like enzyme